MRPYSGYKVGAALLCRDGSVVCGANIEKRGIRSFQLRRAHGNFTAVFEGKREFEAIAVVGGKDGVARDFFPALRRVPAGDAGILRPGF